MFRFYSYLLLKLQFNYQIILIVTEKDIGHPNFCVAEVNH